MGEPAMFFWGAFGAILPQILKFYISLNKAPLPTVSLRYLLTCIVFAVAAGCFTIAWGPETEFKAIWVGITFPVLVHSLMRRPPPNPE
jgi:hypothetical protein